MNTLRTALAAASLLVSLPTLAATNLVTNGDFESGSGVGQIGSIVSGTSWTQTNDNNFNFIADNTIDDSTFGFAGGVPTIFSAGSGTNLFLWGPDNGTNNGFTGSSNGGKFLAGSGGYASGQVSQTINGLTVGNQYQLTFEWAAGQFSDTTGDYYAGWNIGFGGDFASVGGPGSGSAPSRGFLPWATESFTFTATSASQTLSFKADGPAGRGSMSLLDNVSLVDATPVLPPAPVPEPASLALLLAGGAVVGLAARRQRRRA